MKNILDIYREYRLQPFLKLHPLSVASDAYLISKNFKKSVDTKAIVTAMLLHDMGNIIKCDLEKFPQACQPEGLAYWQKVQQDYFEKYGHDEDVAHDKIAEELGMPDKVKEYIQHIGFNNIAETIIANDNFEQKICQYADLRVGPFGVLSVAERLEEGRVRYGFPLTERELKGYENARVLERQVFEYCTLSPEDITDETIREMVSELKNFEVEN